MVKNLPPNASAAEDAPLIPWLGRLIPWRRNPTLVFLPNNPTDRGELQLSAEELMLLNCGVGEDS